MEEWAWLVSAVLLSANLEEPCSLWTVKQKVVA